MTRTTTTALTTIQICVSGSVDNPSNTSSNSSSKRASVELKDKSGDSTNND